MSPNTHHIEISIVLEVFNQLDDVVVADVHTDQNFEWSVPILGMRRPTMLELHVQEFDRELSTVGASASLYDQPERALPECLAQLVLGSKLRVELIAGHKPGMGTGVGQWSGTV